MRCLRIFSFLFLVSALCACGEPKEIGRPDFETYFTEVGIQGSFLLYDLNRDQYTYYNKERCNQGFLPASTFKVMNSLIGLESGVIEGADHVFPWDSVVRELVPAWNQDHTLRSAIKYSVVWYYQELARQVGPQAMQEYLDAADYGNGDISAGIDLFWLEGSFKVSQYGQVEMLKALYKNELPFAERNMEIVKEIMIVDQTDDYTIRAKTGFAIRVEPNIGWWIGYVEKGEDVYFFATNIAADSPDFNEFATARKSITLNILEDLGILPSHE